MQLELTLKAPLGADWSEQYCRLWLKDVSPGMPLGLTIAGAPAPFQYTGATPPAGTEILVRLGLARDETKTLVFSTAAKAATDLRTVALPLRDGASIGSSERELAIPPPEAGPEKSVAGPFCGFAGYRFESRMMGCATAFEGATLERLGDGPLFTDYRLCYAFA
ncbi:MAG: hypothetical protein HYV36_07475, partial [Lentisphaerae bacterium]|nr:hypothetical protein [Lentisphaerota bacterium]